jgi:hypothetical protein
MARLLCIPHHNDRQTTAPAGAVMRYPLSYRMLPVTAPAALIILL